MIQDASPWWFLISTIEPEKWLGHRQSEKIFPQETIRVMTKFLCSLAAFWVNWTRGFRYKVNTSYFENTVSVSQLSMDNLHCNQASPDRDGGPLVWWYMWMCVWLTWWWRGSVCSALVWECEEFDSLMCVRCWATCVCGCPLCFFLFLFHLSLPLIFYLSWPGHVQIQTIQQFWRVDCINLNNGSLFPFLSHSQPRRWLQAHAHHGDPRAPRGRR